MEKPFFVMTLITPPIASEPYTAEAPSFSTSMRSMAAVGMVLRSTPEPVCRPMPEKTMRRPFRSTRVRRLPRPRRSTRTAPLPPLFTWAFTALPCSGIAWRKSPRLTLPLARIASRLITVTGAGVLRSLRRMRVPVTTISSVFSLSLAPVAAG